MMQTFLRHARDRKQTLDAAENAAANALGAAWRCLDAGDPSGTAAESGGNEDSSADKENIFVILIEFVNKFDREVNLSHSDD